MTQHIPEQTGIASDLLSLQVNYLPNILQPNQHTSVSIREALAIMQDPGLQPAYAAVQSALMFGGENEYKEAKLRLPAFCFQGTVVPGTAISAANLKYPTGIMVLDADRLENAAAALQHVTRDPHVAFAFISPSGAGLKIGVYVKFPELPVTPAAYSNYYKQVQAQATIWWPWLETDNSSCNINRLCFSSPHPACVNEAAVAVEVLPYVAPIAGERTSAKYTIEQLKALLSRINPGLNGESWLYIMMACHDDDPAWLWEFNEWSSGQLSADGQTPHNYTDMETIKTRWDSLGKGASAHITLSSLEKLAHRDVLDDLMTVPWKELMEREGVAPDCRSDFENLDPEPVSDVNALGLFTPDEQYLLDNMYVLKEGGASFYVKDTGDIIGTAARLDQAFGKLAIGPNGITKPSSWLSQQNDSKVVSGIGWEPSRDPQNIIDIEGKTYVNTYRAPTTGPVRNDAILVRWLQLMKIICGEQSDLVLDHLAFSCQRPGEKIRWQVLIHGAPRTGKTLAFRPLGQVFKGSMGLMDADSDSHSWGDSYKENKFIIFEEVNNSDTKHFNRLKAKLANDDIERLNIKGKTMHVQRNVYSMYMFSNSETALQFDADQDKLLVIRTPDKTFDKAFFNDLADQDMKDPGFAGAFYWYMLNRDISDFMHGALPVRTVAMEAMVENSKPDNEQYLIEALEDDQGPFKGDVTTEQEIKEWFKQNYLKVIGRKPLEKIINDHGWMRCRGRKYGAGNVTLKHTFIGRVEDCGLMDSKELYDFYEQNNVLFPER